MQQAIIGVEPLPQTRLQITWADQSESVVDLRPLLAKGGVFAALADHAGFETVQIGERGRTLIWRDDEGDEIDLCADALWQMARGKVSAAGAGAWTGPLRDGRAATSPELRNVSP